jgi:glycosyltransferase involved in cell wall biosynthesis
MPQPFFSIGITTYNRHDLLKEALESILSQNFTDFEVIVGNDYQAEVLTGEMLGITDSRVRFVNYPQNLREIGNMNALLESAGGRYFTWLFDDDLFEPGFFQAAFEVLNETGFPPALFSSYRVVKTYEVSLSSDIKIKKVEVLTGREYLVRYFKGSLKIISTCGFFDADAIRTTIGGMKSLSSSKMGLYSEFLLLVQSALFDRIAYMDAPYAVFRAHPDSWSEANVELETYLEAGQELVRRCAEVMRTPALAADLEFNLRSLCKLHVIYPFSLKAAAFEFIRNGFSISSAVQTLKWLGEEVSRIRNLYVAETVDNGYRSKWFFFITHLKAAYIALHALERARARKLKG